MSLAKNNQLEPVSFPWLNGTMEKAVQPSIEAMKRCSAHPATKRTHPRLSLCDKFHEGNTKQEREFLRRTRFVKELNGIDTETAEQLNAFLGKSLYYLDCLSPLRHILMLRNLIALRNRQINKNLVGKDTFSFDVLGRAVCLQADEGTRPVLRMEPPPKKVCPLPLAQESKSKKRVPTPKNVDSDSVQYEVLDNDMVSNVRTVPMVVNPSTAADIELFNLVKPLFKGLPNPLNNCWINATMVAVRHTLGFSTLYEDILTKENTLEDIVS